MATLNTPQKQPKKRRRIIWSLVVVVALAFTWRVVSVVRSSRSPFSDKHKVLASIPWKGSHNPLDALNVNKEHYTWFDNDTIIYSTPMEQQKNTLKMPKYKVMRQRVRGGQPSPAESLSYIKPLNFSLLSSVSPNRKWLLLVDDTGVKSSNPYLVYALDKSGLKQQYDAKLFSTFWLPDEQSFGGLVVKGKIAQYGVYKHGRKGITFPQQLNGSIVFSCKGEYFASEANPTIPPTIKLEHGSIFGGKPQIHTLPLHEAAPNSTLYSVSPTGDRLLWFQAWSRDATRLAMLNDKIMQRGAPPTHYETWYVTDIRGKNPRTLTKLHNQYFYVSQSPQISLFPQWLPDGKHLSVVYKGALYVVPVP